MSSSSATIIDHPDFATTAPNGAALNICPGTLGVSVRAPGGTNLLFTSIDFQGGGSVDVEQGGIGSGVNAVTRRTIGALTVQGQLLPALAAATQIPAPDFSVGDGAGVTSFQRISTAVDGLDWVGGIAVPRLPGGAQAFGTVLWLMNISNGGQAINILDETVGGAVRVGATSYMLGFLETCAFIYDNNGWNLFHKGGSVRFQGGFQLGARRIKSSSVGAKKLVFVPRGVAWTNGMSFVCDVTLAASGGLAGSAQYFWFDVNAAWDGADVNIKPLSVSEQAGNAAAAAAGITGAELSLSDDAQNHNLVFTPPSAAAFTVTATNLRHACPAF